MNMVLLEREDFVTDTRAVIRGRRAEHVIGVHRAVAGMSLRAGVLGGKIGSGHVISTGDGTVEFELDLVDEPPPPLPLTLLLALPRPKVIRRILLTLSSMGVKRIFLLHCEKVEKSYWSSPRLHSEAIRAQLLLGLEQACDTFLPAVEIRKGFRPFVEDELPDIARGMLAFVADPAAVEPLPHDVRSAASLAVGPEGGFTEREITMLAGAGFRRASLGPRALRVEAAVPALIGRLF